MAAKLIPIDKTGRDLRPKSDLASKQVRAGYKPSKKHPNIVPPPTFGNATPRAIYRTGDGDTVSILRAGALDAKRCPSRGMI